MRDNKLWEGHRIILPEMRGKAVNHCRDCRFLVRIQGREEIRLGCVASVPRFGTLQRRVPEKMQLVELLRWVKREELNDILDKGDLQALACGAFRPKTKARASASRASSWRSVPPDNNS
jgi:hypothetical protein